MELNKVNDGIHQYIEVVLPNNNHVDSYLSNMVLEVPSGLVKCVCTSEMPPSFKYGITGKKSLSRLQIQGFRADRFLTIVKSIAQILLTMSDYLIDIRHIHFSDETIFVDALNDDVELLLIPIKQTSDNCGFKQWLVRYLSTHGHRQSHLMNNGWLFDYVRSDEFCIAGLIELIDDHIQAPKPQQSASSVPKREESIKTIQKDTEKPIKKLQINYQFKILHYLSFLLWQVLVALVYALLFILIPQYTSDVLAGRLGALLIAISLDVYVSKCIISHFKMQWPWNLQMPSIKRDQRSVSRNQRSDFETSVLKPAEQYPYLVDRQSDQSFTIAEDCVIIGRQRDIVDILLSENTIGRKHCIIERSGQQYHIVDMFSKNGTFVNELRLDASVPCELNHGDVIKVADKELYYYAY